MGKNKKDQCSQQSDSKLNQLPAEKKREDPRKRPRIPLPNKPTTPAMPDVNPEPTRPLPGVNEPKKNDPTRIDEPLPIFNNK